MAIIPGTIADIRTAVIAAIEGMTPTHQVDGERFVPTEEDHPTGWRTFAVFFDMPSFRWKREGDAAHGASGSSWSVLMRVRVGYPGKSRVEVEDSASEDAVQILHKLHPQTQIHACVISFLDETSLEQVVGAEDGGPVFEHSFRVNFLHAYP